MEEARLAGAARLERLASEGGASADELGGGASSEFEADDDEDEQLDAVVDALNELRQ
eukprot:COSAG06_NODE_28852_length_566_cov_5.036403_2_plen_56_part_01